MQALFIILDPKSSCEKASKCMEIRRSRSAHKTFNSPNTAAALTLLSEGILQRAALEPFPTSA